MADAHGLVEDDILESVYPMFNIFIIHTFKGEEHKENANRHIKKIKEKVINPLIFMIIHEDDKKNNNFISNTIDDVINVTISGYKNLID